MRDTVTRNLTAPPPGTTEPFVSLVMPVRNEGRFLRATLEQLLAQDYPADRFEILVADGLSTDDTPDIVRDLQKQHPNLRLLSNPRRWSSAGRNVAITAARGDLIVLVDGHCQVPGRDYLREIVAAFERSGADCVGRPQPLDVTGASSLQQAIAAARASRLGHHPDSFIYAQTEGFVPPQSVATAYRREVFEAVGLFDERFDACEDVDFNQRCADAGRTCFFTPRVAVTYHPRATLPGLFRQMTRYGRGRVRLGRKHPHTRSLKSLLPGLFLLGMLAGPLLCWWSPLRMAYLSTLALYALVVLTFTLILSVAHRRPGWVLSLPVIYPTIHFGAGYGILREWLSGAEQAERLPPRPQEGREHAERDSEPCLLSFPPHPIDPRQGSAFRRGVTGAGHGSLSPRYTGERGGTIRTLNALTIDVEDYFQVSAFESVVAREAWPIYPNRVEVSTERILARLEDAGVKATFFVLGWLAERFPALVQRIHEAGHEIGSHGTWHRLIYTQTPEEFRADLRHTRDLLQDILGQKIVAYRAPSFSVTKASLWALDILLEEGFTLDSSIYPTWHHRYGIPGTPLEPHPIQRPAGTLWEFPPPVCSVLGYPLAIGGGGYFRLYPYALTRLGLRSINASGRPFAVYLHPWEFDPEQPRIRAGLVRSFRHYVGLRRTESRLVRLLRDFAFGTLSEALAAHRPESVEETPLRRAA
jgi:succinoglycan biosynthesis protein ExoA